MRSGDHVIRWTTTLSVGPTVERMSARSVIGRLIVVSTAVVAGCATDADSDRAALATLRLRSTPLRSII
jgi:hypothetical protein